MPLTPEQAEAMLPDGEYVHTFRQARNGMLVGADWSRERLLEAFREHRVDLSGPTAVSMGHGLIVFDGESSTLFVATKEPSDD